MNEMIEYVLADQVECETVGYDTPHQHENPLPEHWAEVVGEVGKRLPPGHMTVVPAQDDNGPGGRIVLIARPDAPGKPPVHIVMTANQAAALMSRLGNGLELATRHVG